MTQFLFIVFAIIVVASALRVITARNPVHSALSLVLAFVASAGLWLLLEAEFLAIALVLVYVGAVMVLFLFVVMMLDINLAPLREGFIRYLPVGIVVGVFIVIELVLVLGAENFGLDLFPAPERQPADYSNTEMLGTALYTEHLFAFELAAFLLLLAIVAAIVLTMRRRPGLKAQDVSRQVAVRREDRVRLVQMKAEHDT